ncbi:LON peptidase substrate-binding domain-containing protein [Simplicispira psychrophila]|uniref:LON peptidase substrate-binding domain-containing protein n=1 Tax=Simplicispira psychrophila TaxID=80882 RepID=UPI000487AC6A|nr:LON peptidase substrate-binding domain-containing protein [Simplicispira psychrophila]
MTQPLTLKSLPLFPLDTVLFPGGTLALRVFEVRYLDMVRKCHQAGAPFGVVSLRSGTEVRRAGAPQEQFHCIGTLAHIDQLQTPQPGLLTISCRASQRFRILARTLLAHGLWVADIEQLPDDLHIPIPDDLAPCATALAQVLATLRQRDPQGSTATTPTPAQLRDSGWIANRWCELLPIALPLRQQLMELDSPLVRLELVSDVLERNGIAPI